MKGAKLIFTLFEVLFVAVVPVALVIYQYGYVQPTSAAFKISLTGIILIALVFYGVKKVILDRKLRNWEAQYNNYVSAYKIETDLEKKERAKQEMQKKADLAFKEMEQEILKVIKQDERSAEALKEILNRAKERMIQDD